MSMILLEKGLPGLGVRRYRLDAKLAFISYVTLSLPLSIAEVWKVGQWGWGWMCMWWWEVEGWVY